MRMAFAGVSWEGAVVWLVLATGLVVGRSFSDAMGLQPESMKVSSVRVGANLMNRDINSFHLLSRLVGDEFNGFNVARKPLLFDEHRIAVTEKAITLCDGGLVNSFLLGQADHCGDERD